VKTLHDTASQQRGAYEQLQEVSSFDTLRHRVLLFMVISFETHFGFSPLL
jgi:hypothetical protein